MKKCILWGAVLFCLAGCSSVSVYDAELGRERRLQQQVELHDWSLQGRLLIKSNDVLTANIQWQHNDEKDVLKLSGVFGISALLIELNEHEIVLDDGQLKRVSQEIDQFVAQQIGFYVPLTALRDWVVGRHVEGVPVKVFENGFQQLGWRIAYSRYMDTSVGVMPQKIIVTKENIKLKLVIDQWEIE